MTELKSLSAPAIGQREIERLLDMTRPTRLTSNSSLFDAGVEQAKKDFRTALLDALRIPHNYVDAPDITPEEAKAADRARFFSRWLKR